MARLNDWNAVVIDGEIYERRKVIKSGKHVVITLPMYLWRYVWDEPKEVALDVHDDHIVIRPVPRPENETAEAQQGTNHEGN